MKFTNPLLALGFAAMPLSASLLPMQEEPPKAAPASDAGALIKKLGDKDYKARKEAFKQLEKLGPAARGELEKALKNEDPEVRWSASLLLDRLDDAEADGALGGLRARDDEPAPRSDPAAPGVRRFRPLRTPEDALQEMREAIRRLEEWQKKFDADRGDLDGWFHGSPFGLRLFDDPFRGVDGFDGFGQGADELQLGPGSSFSCTTDHNGQRESLTIKVDADGRVTAEQEKDGQKSTFQADSIEALRAEHPELMEHLGVGGMQLRVGPLRRGAARSQDPAEELRPRARANRPQLEKPGAREAAPAPDRPRLGVQVRPVSPDLAAWLELDEGVGLEVVEVVGGSAAEKLGVKPRDILTAINGHSIGSIDDVAKALAGKDPAQAELTVLRRGESKTLQNDRKH